MLLRAINRRTLALLQPINPKLPRPICKVSDLGDFNAPDNSKSPICLTFDDGPEPVYTQKILDILDEYDVKASFFVLGKAAEKFPKLIEQMARAGHTIGNHSYNHHHPWMISSDCARQEVIRTTSIIKSITGNVPRWFRPPFGRLRIAMRKQAHKDTMATVLWSHSIIDWGLLGTEFGISKRLQRIEPNDIVLMHDGKREQNHPDIIIQCLPGFLRSLKDSHLMPYSLDGLC